MFIARIKFIRVAISITVILSTVGWHPGTSTWAADKLEATKQPNVKSSIVHPQGGLVELINLALKRNPKLKQIQYHIKALEKKIPQAGAWMDPMLGVSYLNAPVDTFSLGDFAMSGIEVKYSQTIPFFGKSELRERIADKNLKQAEWTLQESTNALKTLLRKTYYSLSLTRQLRKLTRKHIKLVEQFLAAVKFKYEAGTTGQHDLLRLRVLRGELLDKLGDYQKDEATYTASINAVLHRPVSTAVQTPKDLHAHNSPSSEDQLLQRAKESRPELRRLFEQEQMFHLGEKLARKEAFPDVTGYVAYRYRDSVAGKDDGTDFASLGVSVPLPLFYEDRYGAKALEQGDSAKSARQAQEATLDTIAAGIKTTYAVLERAYSKAKMYRTRLLPDAKSTLDATFSAYQVGRADFASFYQAELKLLEFDRALRVAQATTHIALAELEMLVGEDF